MGILGDTWSGIKSGASEIGGWAEDAYDGAGNLIKRGGQAVGLVKPDDLIDEQGAMAPATVAADEVLRRALEQQNLLNQGITTGQDITRMAGAYGGPQTITPERIGGVLPQTQVMADWKQSSPIERITAVQTAPAQNVEMGQVNTNITGPGPMSAAQASALQADRTTVDPLANELRGEQLAAARGLATGPSVADAKFREGMATTAAEQMGLVLQARGAERGSARREAVLGLGAKGIQMSAAAAGAKAQEELAKKQALAAALSGMRSQDATVATTQAGLDAQRAQLNAQLATATSQGNAQAVNALRTQQAQLEQAAKTNTAQLGLSAAATTADVAGQNAARQAQIALANTGATNQFAATNAAAANAQNEANAARATQTSQFNAGQGNTVGANNLQTALDIQKTNAASNLTAQQQNAANDLAAQQQRVSGATAGLNAATGAGQAGTSALGVASGAAGTKADIGRAIIGGQTAQQQSEQASNDRLVKLGATAAGVLAGGPAGGAIAGKVAGQNGTGDDVLPMGSTSDERAKTDVRKISDDDLIRFGESLKAASFKYKPGFEDGGAERNAGVPSAQELERNPVGKLFVSQDADGMRKVDYGQMGALLTSAMLRRQKAGAR